MGCYTYCVAVFLHLCFGDLVCLTFTNPYAKFRTILAIMQVVSRLACALGSAAARQKVSHSFTHMSTVPFGSSDPGRPSKCNNTLSWALKCIRPGPRVRFRIVCGVPHCRVAAVVRLCCALFNNQCCCNFERSSECDELWGHEL